MQYFLDTTETIVDGVGFPQYGSVHILWLAVFLFTTVANCIFYRRLEEKGKGCWRKTVAVLLIADELFKVVMLLIGGRYNPSYLPLHLCSINIFIIAIHAWRPTAFLDGFLYTIAIPGALAALIFPSWTALPFGNFMHLHSFTVHILLALYPIVLATAGELKPDLKKMGKSMLLLVCLAIPIYAINILLDTNFMFLMSADEGNPLYLFEQLWGNHLYGFPIIITGVLLVMYGPLLVFRKIKAKRDK